MKGKGDPENKEWLGLASVTFTGEKCCTQLFILKFVQITYGTYAAHRGWFLDSQNSPYTALSFSIT